MYDKTNSTRDSTLEQTIIHHATEGTDSRDQWIHDASASIGMPTAPITIPPDNLTPSPFEGSKRNNGFPSAFPVARVTLAIIAGETWKGAVRQNFRPSKRMR